MLKDGLKDQQPSPRRKKLRRTVELAHYIIKTGDESLRTCLLLPKVCFILTFKNILPIKTKFPRQLSICCLFIKQGEQQHQRFEMLKKRTLSSDAVFDSIIIYSIQVYGYIGKNVSPQEMFFIQIHYKKLSGNLLAI